MRKIAPRALLPMLILCQFSSWQLGLPSFAKDTQPEDLPGTVDGVKIKMQPQFQEVNDKFRQIYGETRTRTIKKSQPIIVAVNDFLILNDGPRKETTQVITDKYTLLKSVDYIVLASFVVLALDTDQILSDNKLQQVRELESLSKKALASLDNCGLKGEMLDRQKQLINMALTLMSTTIKDKEFLPRL